MRNVQDFQLFIKPVGAICNLACSYCYYLHNPAAAPAGTVMSDHMLEVAIARQMEAARGMVPFFTWHGGEPLLAGLSFFEKAVAIQKRLAPAGVVVQNGIQTNGTLITREWSRFFAENQFHVGISIDGPERFHNRYRTHPPKEGSFNRVISGYGQLLEQGVSTEALCVVHAHNVLYPLELYRFFKDLGVRYITFLPLVVRQPSGAVHPSSVDPDLFGAFLCAIFDEWVSLDIGKIKVQIFEEAARTAFGQEHTLCIFRGECGRVPVLEWNGNLYSCDHYTDLSHHLGNIEETPLSQLLASEAQQQFGKEKSQKLPSVCRRCPVVSYCNGGCPKDRFIGSEEGEPGLNYLCEGYKLFFLHAAPFIKKIEQVWRANRPVSL